MTPRGPIRFGVSVGAVALALLFCLTCAPAYDADTLFQDLQSDDPEVRVDARESLEKIMVGGDYKVLVRGLDSTEPMIRVQSILYLSRMPQPDARAALRELLRADRRMMLPFNPIRLKATREKHDSRILVAHLIASREGDPEALPVLLDGLDQSLPAEVLEGACYAVGALGDERGVPFLASAINSRDIGVVRASVQALGRFQTREALESIREAVSHPSQEVRGEALSALDLWSPADVKDLLLEIAGSDSSGDIRASAIHRLGSTTDPSLVPFLIDQLATGQPVIASPALGALRQLTGENIGNDPGAWRLWWDQRETERSGG